MGSPSPQGSGIGNQSLPPGLSGTTVMPQTGGGSPGFSSLGVMPQTGGGSPAFQGLAVQPQPGGLTPGYRPPTPGGNGMEVGGLTPGYRPPTPGGGPGIVPGTQPGITPGYRPPNPEQQPRVVGGGGDFTSKPPGWMPNNPNPKVVPGTPGPGGGGENPIHNPGGKSVYDKSSDLYDAAIRRTQQAMNYKPQTLDETSLAGYMNPYTRRVIDASVADMDRSRQMVQNQNGAAATAAGAFGGSRHGLVEAETNRGFADQVGQLSSSLRQQGYNNAQAAAQNDLARQDAQNQNVMAGGRQLAGLSQQGFGYGQELNNDLQQQGALQQQMMQQVIDAGKQQWEGYTGAGDKGLQRLLAMLGGSEYPTTQKTSKTPGLGDWAGLIPSFWQ